jgi:hypothetical protein
MAYNVAVGSTGLFTLASVHLIARVPPSPVSIPLEPTLIIPVIYGLLANVCYTGGWVLELWIRNMLGREMEPVGPTLSRYGFAFSMGLTLFPVAMISLLKFSLVLRAIL